MFEANIKIIAELKHFINYVVSTPDTLRRFCVCATDFTRSRKLPFDKLVIFIVRLCKKTLSVELESFFEQWKSSAACSVSAFSQQRLKLEPAFFYFWNKVLCISYYFHYGSAVKRWKGYRVVAADGSSVSLINNGALRKHFGSQKNQYNSFVTAKTFYHYDVLNELIVHAQIKPYRYGEVNMAYDATLDIQPDMLMLYDRNFCSYKMVALHAWQERECKFVIRLKETMKMAKLFIASGQACCIVHMQPNQQMIKALKATGFIITKKTLIPVRLVRVELPQGVEVLLTNLWEQDGHRAEEFKDIYFQRWAVETNISIQKNVAQLESFSGLTVQAVMQDFYATVMMVNLQSVLIKDAQQSLQDSSQQRKHPLKVNRNKSFGRLKMNVVMLFITNDLEEIMQKLHDYFVKDPVPVRKGRSVKRERKNIQSKSKYKTFTNFKPSY